MVQITYHAPIMYTIRPHPGSFPPSDGGQPHLINVQFHKKMTIVEIAFHLDFTSDEVRERGMMMSRPTPCLVQQVPSIFQ